jgi:fumarate reductase subunit D
VPILLTHSALAFAESPFGQVVLVVCVLMAAAAHWLRTHHNHKA